MKSTVVGSFPAKESSPSNFKDKLLNTLGMYDPFKEAIKNSVIAQLDAGVDIISDGQVRGDMVSIFTKYIPGMKIEDGNTVIVSKIRNPTQEISIKDMQYAKKVMSDYYGGTLTWTDSSITENSIIEPYATLFGVTPSNIVTTTGRCEVTFDAQDAAFDVLITVRN